MISDNRSSHLSHLIYEKLWGDDIVDFGDEAVALRDIKRGFEKFLKEHEDTDKKAKSMISSQSRSIMEGTAEWETLYRKYYETEMKRKGLD